MFSWIDSHAADRVDRITHWHGAGGRGEIELSQLSRLFHPRYLRSLHRVLDNAQRAVGPRRSLDMKLAWIDKIPVAEVALKKPRTELGDAVIFAIEGQASRNGTVGKISARAVLLQAKVAERKSQIVAPRVPISAMRDSTKREFDLLSDWPIFDLYKAGGSGTALVNGLDLRGTASGPLPLGWYIAAPRPRRSSWPIAKATWSSWWMAGPPVQGHACDTSFGRFLQSALNGSKVITDFGGLAAGKSFSCASYPPPISGATGWDRVCAEIIGLAEGGSAPQSIFTSSVKRIASMPQTLGFHLQTAKPTTIFAHGHAYDPCYGPFRPKWSWPPFHCFEDDWQWLPPFQGWDARESDGDRGMYVLVIRSIIPEG